MFLIGIQVGIAQESDILAPGAVLRKLPGEYGFTEGPAADPWGNVYFTDQPNDRILKWDGAEGQVVEWMKPAGRANGLFVASNGQLLAAADEHNQLWSIGPDKAINQGNVYLTGRGVTVFDKTGKQIEHIDIPQPWTANVTFGGTAHNLLFITASKAAYTIEMRVKGIADAAPKLK